MGIQEVELGFLPSCTIVPITMLCIIVLGCILFAAPFTYLGMSALKNNERSYLVPSIIVRPIVFTVLVGIVTNQCLLRSSHIPHLEDPWDCFVHNFRCVGVVVH